MREYPFQKLRIFSHPNYQLISKSTGFTINSISASKPSFVYNIGVFASVDDSSRHSRIRKKKTFSDRSMFSTHIKMTE